MSEAKARLKRGGKRFSKFTIVGLSNSVIDIGVLNLFLWLQPTREVYLLVIYNAIALVLANLNSYVWNTLWTFRSRAEHDLRQIVLFALQVLVNVVVSSGLFWALIHPIIVYTEVPTYLAGNVAKIISVTVASTISFFIMRYVVFSRKRWFKDRL
ncbi:MAG TPA: GtrA family protein [Rubrobacter sp.]|nr:GtrA family protein [Rubrobacter sp.]